MTTITIVYLECLAMPNGELIHQGNSLGWLDQEQRDALREGTCQACPGGDPVLKLKTPSKAPVIPVVFEPADQADIDTADQN